MVLEDEPSWGTFPPTATGLGLLGMAGAALVLRGRRASGGLLALAALAGIVDEAQNGPRILRRLVRRRRTTVNLVARVGEQDAGERDGTGTLVVLAHHDAPQTGFLFDQTLQRRLHELAPGLLERVKTPPPQWWIGLAGPLSTVAAAVCGRRWFARAGLVIGAIGTGLVADVWRSPTVPGANDNLSGVAALVALGELLRNRPVSRLQRAAGLLRGRGDAAGRRARVPRAPPARTGPRAHVVREPRHGGLTPPGHARGGGSCLDGVLRRPVAARPARGARRAARDSDCSAASAHAHRPTA